MYENTKVLITGGAGYIGNVLIEKMLEHGYIVRVIDNLIHDQCELIRFAGHPNYEFVYGDVTDVAMLYGHVQWADIIIPLAAFVGAPACDKNHVMTTKTNKDHVVNVAIWAGSRKVVYPNTNSGYGIGIKNDDGEVQHCTEDSPLNPISHYGKTKVEAEKTVLASGGVSLRLATVFGVSPRMRLDLLVNDFVYKALTDKSVVLFESHFKRNYIHIQDVVEAFLFSIDRYDEMSGEAYNVGLSTANLSKLELCQKIVTYIPDFAIMEYEINKDPDQRNYIVSNDKIEALGYKQKYSLDHGIKELIQAYRIILNTKHRFRNN